MTVKEQIMKAVDTRDAKLAGRLVNWYRAQGATYKDVLARFQKYRPELTAEDFEAMMQDAEEHRL